MRERTLNVLEYFKVLELVSERACSLIAKKAISNIRPKTSYHLIEEQLRSTTESVDLIVRKGRLPIGALVDVSGICNLAMKGATLTGAQLLDIATCLRVSGDVRAFILAKDVESLTYLRSVAGLLDHGPRLLAAIEKAIISADEISDNASSKLRDIRRQKSVIKNSVRSKLQKLVSGTYSMYLQDAIVTMRDGRYVIPVKQEHRGKVPGLIHDQSKGGATVFIEPQAVVELNNQLKALIMEEEVEINRILGELSSMVGEHGRTLANNQKLLIELDVACAKGQLAIDLNCSKPNFSKEHILDLKEARHPLLPLDKAVPMDLAMTNSIRSLIITGPNTGGKTVTLKTVGLLALMAQSGLHIPAAEGSYLPIFNKIFADIGDEQSIEQSLSTFSSHMTNVISILKDADEKSLVLLDEAMAGTDPTEGSALAVAVLEHLRELKAMVIATTHYNQLKKYAINTDGVENGSMEFDIRTLSPTYRLKVGIAGHSNAFEISQRLGLPEEIVQCAKTVMEEDALTMERLVKAIDKEKEALAAEKEELAQRLTEAEEKVKEASIQAEKMQAKISKELEQAKDKARKIIEDAEQASKEVQQELKAIRKLENIGTKTNALNNTRRKIKEQKGKYDNKIVEKIDGNHVSPEEIKVGSKVKIPSLGQNGQVLEEADGKGQVMVQVGNMKTKIHGSKLILLEQGPPKKISKKTKYAGLYQAKAKSVSPSITVQGENLEDALFIVGKYIDDAFIAGLKKVTIIHGRGEGILKRGIREQLKSMGQVKTFSSGSFEEGGDGVTVVTLK